MINKEVNVFPNKNFPVIKQNVVNSNENGSYRHSKVNSMNYFNRTAGVLVNINKNSFTKARDELQNKKIRIPDLNKIKSRTSDSNVYNHRAIIPISAKRPLDEENNDSFITELEDLLTNVNNKKGIKGNNNDDENNDAKSADDEQPDPRINFEKINEVNKARPQTSYGGLNQRRKKLQIALKSAKYRTSNNNINNIQNFNNHNSNEGNISNEDNNKY